MTSTTTTCDAPGRRNARDDDGVRTAGWLSLDSLRPVAELKAANEETYRFITDHLGSVRVVVRMSDGEVVERTDDDAWGEIVSGVPIGFAGGLHDRVTGLVHFGAREYDPVTGRLMQKDPIRFAGGDTNIYASVGGDPMGRVDPPGSEWVDTVARYGDGLTRHMRDWIDIDDVVNTCDDDCKGGAVVGSLASILLSWASLPARALEVGGLSLKQSMLYELGQKALPTSMFNALRQGQTLWDVLHRGAQLRELGGGLAGAVLAGQNIAKSIELYSMGTGVTPYVSFFIRQLITIQGSYNASDSSME